MSLIKPKFNFFLLSRNEVIFVIGPQTVKPFWSSLKLLLARPGVQRLFTSSTQGRDVQVFPFPILGRMYRENIFCPLWNAQGWWDARKAARTTFLVVLTCPLERMHWAKKRSRSVYWSFLYFSAIIQYISDISLGKACLPWSECYCSGGFQWLHAQVASLSLNRADAL